MAASHHKEGMWNMWLLKCLCYACLNNSAHIRRGTNDSSHLPTVGAQQPVCRQLAGMQLGAVKNQEPSEITYLTVSLTSLSY